jgi:hypothetical protein
VRVLDLFAGLGGWAKPFEDAGHDVETLDIDPRFDCTYTGDVRNFYPRRGDYDVIFASPPCEAFSVASIGHHWGGGWRAYEPKTEHAETSRELVLATLGIIETVQPLVAVIENPRGVLRKLGIIPVDPVTVWYCHYGEQHAKPTDLWGLPFPENWSPRPKCHNRRPEHGEDCCCRDHEAASRGAKTGTQGIDGYANRSLIPYELADSFRLALEQEAVA